MKLGKAVAKLYLYHILFVFISLFLIVPLWTLVEKLPFLYSSLTGLIYVIAMYSIGWNCGKMDSRKIPGFYPNPKFPFIAAAMGLILPVILLIFRLVFPDIWPLNLPFVNGEYDFFLSGNRLAGTADFIFKTWYFPLEAFLGNSNIVTYILVMLVQPLFFIAGYFVGLTKFRILDVVMEKLVYAKKKQQQNQKSPWNK
ncbi:hypothetical protein [Ructibacterium gallinarum]|uniref:Uncharacterized protein n=1 Tax=Ructibacterium gallinarum TaxID=2779355 RepID=A0A9D5R8B7_9FIRM|nr:hypothetical protein [Ructibacterium gallinarum]MBE5039294.1 hypothetical protein [Ructibacterium gallinarum]